MKTKLSLISIFVSLAAFSPLLSAEIAVGKPAPDFSAADISGKTVSLEEFQGKYRVLEWTNHECPFVVKQYGSGNMQKLQKTYTEKEVVWITINSSAPGKQGNFSPEKWQEILKEKHSSATATLLDPEGKVGRLYGAQTTPHMYIIDPNGILIYQGAIDSVPSTDQADIEKAQNYVQTALDEALAGKPVNNPSTKSYGCSVKY